MQFFNDERERERKKKREKRDRETELVLDQSGLSSQTWTGFQWLYHLRFGQNMHWKGSMHHHKTYRRATKTCVPMRYVAKIKPIEYVKSGLFCTGEWHTGMRQLDAPRHNLGHPPSTVYSFDYIVLPVLEVSKFLKPQNVQLKDRYMFRQVILSGSPGLTGGLNWGCCRGIRLDNCARNCCIQHARKYVTI